MPLHKLNFTLADAVSLVTCALFLIQPGVDRKAVVQWLTDNVYGSTQAVSSWGIFTFHKALEWSVMIFYCIIYWLAIPCIERLKVYPNPWPWNDSDPKVRADFRAINIRALKHIIKFHIVVFFITLATSFVEKSDETLDQFRAEKVPEWWVSAYQILVSTFVAESGFYWAHRFLHTKDWYQHHKLHHEFKDSTVLATFYVTWVNSLLTDLIPAGFGIFFFKMHIYTQWMFTIPLIFNAAWVHCGYRMPGSVNPFLVIPLSTESELTHDFHHRNPLCNYGGAYFFWDRVMNTFLDPEKDEK